MKDKNGNLVHCAGMIKMSKSKKNGINPKKIINKYGADSLRLFIIFSAPITADLLWKKKGIKGMSRFLNKIWKIYLIIKTFKKHSNTNKTVNKKKKIKQNAILHIYIKKISYLMNKKKSFNTVISNIMILVKILEKFDLNNLEEFQMYKKYFVKIVTMLYPFAPHISYYILSKIFKKKKLFTIKWPKSKKKIIKKHKKSNTIIFQIDGKTMYKFISKKKLSKKQIFKIGISQKKISSFLKNKKIKKKIFIKNKLINLVTK